MLPSAGRIVSSLVLFGAGVAVALLVLSPLDAADQKPGELKTQVVRWDDAKQHLGDWGEMRFYFRGQTRATRNVLVAAAVVEPGKTVHAAHRHAEEEYLMLVEGSGTWSVDGNEIEARRGDVLYAEPWVYHGVTNTGDQPLIFAVVRYNGKGIDPPPRPQDGQKDEL